MGQFEIFEDASGEFRFRLVAKNGKIIANSEGYTTKQNCKKGIKSLIRNAKSKIVDYTVIPSIGHGIGRI